MYDALTMTELTALQEVLYAATERAYWVLNLAPQNHGWLARYWPVHRDRAAVPGSRRGAARPARQHS